MRKSPDENCQTYISRAKYAVREFQEASKAVLTDAVTAAVILVGLSGQFGNVIAAADSHAEALSTERISQMILNREMEHR